MITSFPPIENADANGVLAMGGDLEAESLLLAYRSGIFPWPHDGMLLWFAPPRRAILEFKDLKMPSRLKRDLKKGHYTFKINTAFKDVIHACSISKNRKGQKGTWITQKMNTAYCALHEAGYAASFETYNTEGKLVGGLYGVMIEKFFAGESMFYTETNASKFALLSGINYLQEQGFTWMDIQMLTPLLKSFGAKEMRRSLYMKKLKSCFE